jgi:hypothetical protein
MWKTPWEIGSQYWDVLYGFQAIWQAHSQNLDFIPTVP